MTSKRPALWLAAASVIPALCACGPSDWGDMPTNSQELIDSALENGAVIVQWLGEYEIEHGAYPASLAELATWRGEDLPPCPAGVEEWSYSTRSDVASSEPYFYLGLCLNRDCYPCYWTDATVAPEWHADF